MIVQALFLVAALAAADPPPEPFLYAPSLLTQTGAWTPVRVETGMCQDVHHVEYTVTGGRLAGTSLDPAGLVVWVVPDVQVPAGGTGTLSVLFAIRGGTCRGLKGQADLLVIPPAAGGPSAAPEP